MQNLFEEAEGWEYLRSLPGSPGTICHILRRYTSNQLIESDKTYAFKTISVRPPATTKLISNKSITFKYKDITQISTEIKAFERLKAYEAIVQLHQVIVQDEKDEQSTSFFREFLKEKDLKGKLVTLILECCPDGTLKDLITSRQRLQKTQIIKVAFQICDCLLCLRDAGVHHRDIRTTNILLTPSGVKLTDFDSAFIKNHSTVNELCIAFNRDTSAPELIKLMEMEVFQKEQFDNEKIFEALEKCDIYSFGCVLFEMLTLKEFTKEKVQSLKEVQIMRDLQELTKKMLCQTVQDRLSLDEVENILNEMKAQEGVIVTKRKIDLNKHASFEVPEFKFRTSTHSQSHSNSLSLSDWSLEEPVPQLYRKEVEHPDIHPTVDSQSTQFRKPHVHHTNLT